MILRTEALVLRWYPVTDSSRIVVWFTRAHGQITTLIRGSQRPKSYTLGQYDLFYTCELLYYAKAKEDLHILRECSPIVRRSDLRSNWRAAAAASFIADFLYRVSIPRHPQRDVYKVATAVLDVISDRKAVNPAVLLWFELQLHALNGVGAVGPERYQPGWQFHVANGGWIDPGHPQATQGEVLSPCSAAQLHFLQCAPDLQTALRTKLSQQQVREISTALGKFTNVHLHVHIPSRDYALDLLYRKLG